eukprot:sb/3468875/
MSISNLQSGSLYGTSFLLYRAAEKCFKQSNSPLSLHQVASSLVLERAPDCQPPPPEHLAKYYAYRDTLATERSVLNDFEVNMEKVKQKAVEERERLFVPKHKYDLLETWTKSDELAQVAEVRNDWYNPVQTKKQSTKPRYLLVQQEDEKWGFPSKWVDKERSLVEAVEGLVQCENQVGRLPISVSLNKYSRRYREHTQLHGEKTFYLKGRYLGGDMEEEGRWCTKEEVRDLIDGEVWKVLEPCLR